MDHASIETSPSRGAGEGLASLLGRHRKLLIAVAVVVAGVGYFGFIAFQNATAYYLTVDELVARGPTFVSQTVQVKGKLVPDTFVREGNGSTVAHFLLADGGEELAATYDGVLPDLFFNSHSEVVLSGQYDESGLFTADRVLVKCPSKYRSEEYAEPPPSSG